MRRASTFAVTFVLLVATAVLMPSPASARGIPLWVKHVRNYPGGISGSVRARLVAIQAHTTTSTAALQPVPGTDVQMNDDCDPPLPQNETSVAINVFDQDNAVAAANDFCGDGFWIGHTTDGGDTWTSEFKDPKLSPDSLTFDERRCFGSDPSVVFSRRASDDFGATWSEAGTVAVTPEGDPAPQDQFFPWLAVDPATGGAFAVWYDNRNDPGNRLIETFVGTSTDGGETWTNTLVSDVAWDPNDAFFSCGCFIGDYNAMAVDGSLLYPVWTDGRNSPGPPLGQSDIFTDVMSLS